MSATAASRRRRSFAAVLRRYGWSYIFVLPTFSLFVVFTLLPVVQGLVLSLQNARVTGGEFIGLANFETLAADPVFIQAVGTRGRSRLHTGGRKHDPVRDGRRRGADHARPRRR